MKSQAEREKEERHYRNVQEALDEMHRGGRSPMFTTPTEFTDRSPRRATLIHATRGQVTMANPNPDQNVPGAADAQKKLTDIAKILGVADPGDSKSMQSAFEALFAVTPATRFMTPFGATSLTAREIESCREASANGSRSFQQTLQAYAKMKAERVKLAAR